MIEGVSIRLRAWQERDLPVLQTLRNDVALQAQLLSRARGSDLSQVEHWVQQRAAGGDSLLLVIADRLEDIARGYIQFTGLDPIDRRADLGLCLAPPSQGRGIGGEAIRLSLSHLVEAYNVRKVSLRVRADNERAIRCYRRLGFHDCGVLRQHVFIDDAWQDVLLMELFVGPRP
jgi:RimJ/RimL family protein N-acetyltransferase